MTTVNELPKMAGRQTDTLKKVNQKQISNKVPNRSSNPLTCYSASVQVYHKTELVEAEQNQTSEYPQTKT